jgi:hypothetical protein
MISGVESDEPELSAFQDDCVEETDCESESVVTVHFDVVYVHPLLVQVEIRFSQTVFDAQRRLNREFDTVLENSDWEALAGHGSQNQPEFKRIPIRDVRFL